MVEKSGTQAQILLTPLESLHEFARAGGGKALNLARLSHSGFQVPPWFCVSTAAFEFFLQSELLTKEVSLQSDDLGAEEERILKLFLSRPLPSFLRQQIAEKLSECGLADAFLAVRSSGLDEDGATHSFAGQLSSFLYQRGLDALDESIRRCWASGFSARSFAYRKENGLPLDRIRVGVVIQEMVDAESAGVAFSRHPIRVLDRNTVLISSVFGLGEGLVSGELDADDFEVSRSSSPEIAEVVAKIAEKDSAVRQAERGGVHTLPLAEDLRSSPSLTDAQAREVAQIAVRLEDTFGAPQDCEWVLQNGEIFLVQTRPITNLPPNDYFSPEVNGGQTILWDNSNIVESYSGVTSPLTFSFASAAYRQVYVQFCEVMGVPKGLVETNEQVFRNMLGLIRGRIYYNLINWYQLVLMLPGSSNNSGFMETMMGVKDQVRPEQREIFDAVSNPPVYSIGRRLVLFAMTLWRFLWIDRIVAGFQKHFNRVYLAARRVNFNELSLSEQVRYYHFLEDELLKKWHAPIINDYLCMLFFGLLKKLTAKWLTLDGDQESLQNDLLCGQGQLDSTEPTRFLMRVAEEIDRGDAEFRSWFISTDPSEVWLSLNSAKSAHPVSSLFHGFLERFGFRCVNELKLEENDLHDDPTFVVNSVQSYVRTQSYDLSKMEMRERQIREQAEAQVRVQLSGWRKIIYLFVLQQARKAVRNRENLRFARTKVFGICRHLFRGIGGNLSKLGFLKEAQEVFYLTVDEIVCFVEGRSLTSNLQDLVAQRKLEFDGYRSTPEPPERFTTQGAVGAAMNYTAVLADADLLRKRQTDLPENVLVGTPCCPGLVEGKVRVVHSLQDAQDIDGDILVTARTDPGWVPLYPSCSGLLIERGSLLSHSAVVARELGLPTIVGISGGLVQRLKTGMRVRIDAGKGEVIILGDADEAKGVES